MDMEQTVTKERETNIKKIKINRNKYKENKK